MEESKRGLIDFYLALSSLLFYFGQGAVWTFIRTQIYDLQGSFFEIMLVSSIPSLLAFIFSGMWGQISDVWVSKKKMIMFGYTTTSIFTLMLVYADTPTQLILVYSILSFFSVSYAPALNALISAGGDGKQGARIGWYTTIFSLGWTAGSMLGGYIAYSYGYDTVYLISAILGLVGSIFMLYYKQIGVGVDLAKRRINSLVSPLYITSTESAMKMLVLSFTIQTFAGSTFYNLYTLIYYELLERNTLLYGLFNGIAGIGSIIAPRLYGGAIDRLNGKRVYTLTSLIYTPYFAALTYFRNIYIVTLLWFIPLWPGIQLPAIALASNIAGMSRAGTYQGILNSYASLARVLGPLIGGLVADYLNARANIDSLNPFLYAISILPVFSALSMVAVRD